MKREYAVLYQPIEDGWIMATVPDLPGAVTQGKTMDEARAMIKKAVELLLQSYRATPPKMYLVILFGKLSLLTFRRHEASRFYSPPGTKWLLPGSRGGQSLDLSKSCK